MKTSITSDTLHRTAKFFMDVGHARTADDALKTLEGFGLNIYVGDEAKTSIGHQIALLTLVNTARRTLLGGVRVIGDLDCSLLTHLGHGDSLGEAVRTLGGMSRDGSNDWPSAVIGTAGDTGKTGWQVTWQGWRGGVIPLKDQHRLGEHGTVGAVFAAATCVAEVFFHFTGLHPMAGRRSSGMSLWSPGRDWLLEDPHEPEVEYLPSELWLIGLGNLGQAYLWVLASLPYMATNDVFLILQDIDELAESNESTSVLTSKALLGQKKTRAMAAWLESRGFRTALEERYFGESTRRQQNEPQVALCGLDNALGRTWLEEAGFGLVVESGLGAGPEAFASFSLHTFPSELNAKHLWGSHSKPIDVSRIQNMPAYTEAREAGMDACGLAQMASRSIGVPFVGVMSASLVIAELLRRLHSRQAYQVISGSVLALSDLDVSPIQVGPYGFGYTNARPTD